MTIKPLKFLHAKRYIQTTQGVSTLDSVVGGKLWIVARSLCYWRLVDLRALAPKEHANFIAVSVLQWTPFKDTDHYSISNGQYAGVWVWDAELVRNAQLEQAVEGADVIPESALLENVTDEGLQLFALAEGYEAQYRSDGFLTAGMWWPELPTAEELRRFLFLADIPYSGAVEPVAASYGKHPPRRNVFFLKNLVLRNVPAVNTLAICAVVFVLTLQCVHVVSLALAANRYESFSAAHAEELEQRRRLRAQLNNLAGSLYDLRKLSPPHAQLALLHSIVKEFPQDFRIDYWSYTDTAFAMIVQAPGVPAQELLTRLNAVALMSEVVIESSGADKYLVKAKLAGEDAGAQQ